MDDCKHTLSAVDCTICVQSTHAFMESYYSRLHDLPDDLDGFLDGICEFLFGLYKPSFMFIQTNDRCATSRVSDDLVLPSASARLPSGIPTKMCKRVVETSIPFISNRLLEKDE